MSIENVVITTEQTSHNEWMAFACWYSVYRNIPDCKVAMVFPRSYSHYQFHWLNKCSIPYVNYPFGSSVENSVDILLKDQILKGPTLIIKDCCMVIREIEDNIEGIVKAESLPCYGLSDSEEMISIVNFEKCGKFNLEEWKTAETKHPFYATDRFRAKNRTVNEQRVLQLWRQMGVTFDFLNRL